MGVSAAARAAACWVRWHAPELAAVTAPTVAAVTLSPWWALPATVVTARWWWQEHTTPPPDTGGVGEDDTAGQETSHTRGTA